MMTAKTWRRMLKQEYGFLHLAMKTAIFCAPISVGFSDLDMAVLYIIEQGINDNSKVT